MISIVFNLLHPFLWAAAGVCLYALIVRRLADLVYPLRMRLARLGEEAIALDGSGDDAKAITLMLDHAFSPFVSILMAVVTPVVGVITIPRLLLIAFGKGQLPAVPTETVKRRLRVFGLFLVSVCAANPIFGFVLILEIFLFFILTMLFLGPTALAKVFLSLVSSETKFFSSFSDVWGGRSTQI